MNEVTKLYENVGLEPVLFYDCESYNQKVNKGYLFTAEKQLELIKWCIDNYRGEIFDTIETEWFAEQLSAYINNLWQDLTKEDKQQIKEILK